MPELLGGMAEGDESRQPVVQSSGIGEGVKGELLGQFLNAIGVKTMGQRASEAANLTRELNSMEARGEDFRTKYNKEYIKSVLGEGEFARREGYQKSDEFKSRAEQSRFINEIYRGAHAAIGMPDTGAQPGEAEMYGRTMQLPAEQQGLLLGPQIGQQRAESQATAERAASSAADITMRGKELASREKTAAAQLAMQREVSARELMTSVMSSIPNLLAVTQGNYGRVADIIQGMGRDMKTNGFLSLNTIRGWENATMPMSPEEKQDREAAQKELDGYPGIMKDMWATLNKSGMINDPVAVATMFNPLIDKMVGAQARAFGSMGGHYKTPDELAQALIGRVIVPAKTPGWIWGTNTQPMPYSEADAPTRQAMYESIRQAASNWLNTQGAAGPRTDLYSRLKGELGMGGQAGQGTVLAPPGPAVPAPAPQQPVSQTAPPVGKPLEESASQVSASDVRGRPPVRVGVKLPSFPKVTTGSGRGRR